MSSPEAAGAPAASAAVRRARSPADGPNRQPAVRTTRFVLFAAPRTGSNWLCTLLDSHPEILCHHEIFNPERILTSLTVRGGELDLGTVEERDRAPQAVLRQVWRHTFGYSAVGFKLNRGQNEAIFRTVLADPDLRKVVVKRRNRIKTYVSEVLAQKTGEWESYPWLEIGKKKVKVQIDVEALREHVAVNERYYAWLEREAGEPLLEVTYEELTGDEERARVLRHLGVSPAAALRSSTRKQNSKDLRDLIANFDQLGAQLAGSDLEPELYSRGL